MAHILVLTHTNPDSDSRILKYLSFFEENYLDYVAIGIDAREPQPPSKSTILIYPHLKKGIDVLTELRVNNRYTRIFLRTFYYFEITIKQFCKGVRVRPKVVHVHDWFSLPSGWLISVLLRARLIYDAHELESDANGVTKEMRFLVKSIERICWPKIDTFITVSRSILGWYMTEYGIKKCEVILNSPKIREIKEDNQTEENYLRDRFNIPDESRVFIYIGVFEFGRGIENYLEAFTRQDMNHHLVFLGSGSLDNAIRKVIQGNNKIHIHEPVTHDQVIHLAKNADFGLCLIEDVSLSDWLCLPNKFFEYAFAGLPMIVSDFPELSEVVQSYSLGIAIGSKSEELVTLLRNDSELDRLKRLVSNSDLHELSLEHQHTKLIALYFGS